MNYFNKKKVFLEDSFRTRPQDYGLTISVFGRFKIPSGWKRSEPTKWNMVWIYFTA